MQTRAIIEAALNVQAQGLVVKAEIMVPLVGTVREFNAQAAVIRATADKVFAERGEHAALPAGHHDRDAARRAGGRQHRPPGRVLLLRHQ
jgi:hypothetical protein